MLRIVTDESGIEQLQTASGDMVLGHADITSDTSLVTYVSTEDPNCAMVVVLESEGIFFSVCQDVVTIVSTIIGDKLYFTWVSEPDGRKVVIVWDNFGGDEERSAQGRWKRVPDNDWGKTHPSRTNVRLFSDPQTAHAVMDTLKPTKGPA